MHTLSQLQSGELVGAQHLKIQQDLTSFPMEILTLADSLEILDLSGNRLSSLPPEFSQLHKLKIVFASNNLFTSLPVVLGQCKNLEMIGFKANQIKHVPEQALPEQLRWLILTDNEIELLPESLGYRPRLQKLALSGNQLKALPQSMRHLHNLELIRISANQLTECPEQLLGLPKLAWLAFSGNPFCQVNIKIQDVPTVRFDSFELQQVLGQGASGVISKAKWRKPQNQFPENQFPEDVAVKVFKGEVTSDGYPQDELQACLKVGNHPNLIQSLAQVNEAGYLALIMELIPDNFYNLGLPPCFDSCTRDNFAPGLSLPISKINKMVEQMTEVFEHLHQNQVCHGDLYAHNSLFDDEANIIVGDFGAATMYHMLTGTQQALVKQIEYRALMHFIDDLLSICDVKDKSSASFQKLSEMVNA
ncbi:leucine-rich repeat-containing serine/threonine-protein kinase [Psychrosphaera sp. B3R10]|uniref:leucine-rich repeat-containing protein kinase family protein n=1 Tax=unclassified Psychrosphaera TaxID=2641570 RepID=UPI001C0903F4|nr:MULTISPECIES: leucine-rich repeat-containing protein kinase family protein [unclassified Psychrosphaera]MBU2882471.1 leucine-rich repeat-containing serine/threonine-protein kinase [Psychrosphaera sp. I2R16]MBU2990292.1 leucine-rich repeat-containing serine/threonine-protein kinase [Psychrosphaera sp. B3R10]